MRKSEEPHQPRPTLHWRAQDRQRQTVWVWPDSWIIISLISSDPSSVRVLRTELGPQCDIRQRLQCCAVRTTGAVVEYRTRQGRLCDYSSLLILPGFFWQSSTFLINYRLIKLPILNILRGHFQSANCKNDLAVWRRRGICIMWTTTYITYISL